MTEGCKMREKKANPQLESVKRNSIVKRYSMPPIQIPNYGLTNNYLIQSRQRLNMESGDAVKLRTNRLVRDDSITKISENDSTPKPVIEQSHVESPGNATESRNSAPEFIMQAQRMRKSWVEQNGLRIEKLLNDSGNAYDQAKKRHSIAVSTMAGSPKPKLLPKPKSPKKTELSIVQQSNDIKPIIPTVPKLKEIQIDETTDKQREIFSFNVDGDTEKKGTYNKLTNNVIKEIKNINDINQENGSLDKSQNDTTITPIKKFKPTTPTKPSIAFSKPKALSPKPTLSPERKAMSTSKIVPNLKTEMKSEEKVSVSEEKTLIKIETNCNEEIIPNETSKQTKPRPPIAQKPRSLQRVKSETGPSMIKYLENKPKSPTEGKNTESLQQNNRKTVVDKKNEKLDEFSSNKAANSARDNITSNIEEDLKSSRNDEFEKNGSKNNESGLVKLIKQSSNTDKNSSSINNNNTQTTDCSSIKEKPIFAFLKAKEANNQQSFYKGSDLNRNCVSSGLSTSAKAFINPSDSLQEFGSSNPIIPQPKIITY